MGNPDLPSPSLMVVSGYGLEDFAMLLETGRALGDQKLGLMSQVAQGRLVSLTAEERRALYRYLHRFQG